MKLGFFQPISSKFNNSLSHLFFYLLACTSINKRFIWLQYNIVFQETLKELFPSMKAVRTRYREVVIFVAGLMKDSRPLVQYIYEMQVEDHLNKMRTSYGPSIDADLFKWLQLRAQFDCLIIRCTTNTSTTTTTVRMKRRRDPPTQPSTSQVDCITSTS